MFFLNILTKKAKSSASLNGAFGFDFKVEVDFTSFIVVGSFVVVLVLLWVVESFVVSSVVILLVVSSLFVASVVILSDEGS